MPLTLFSIPVTNTLTRSVRLYNGAGWGAAQLTLAPGASAVLTLTFDRIRVSAPGTPLVILPAVYIQTPNNPVIVMPPAFAYFRTGPVVAGQPRYVLSVGQPNQNAMTFTFAQNVGFVYEDSVLVGSKQSALACYLPARRATNIYPVVALKFEQHCYSETETA